MPTESTLVWSGAALVVLLAVVPYWILFRRRVARDRARKDEASRLGIDRPRNQFPFVDAARCIGCGACVSACPEGDVLGIVGGTAVVVNGLRCVGHARCEVACPVEAIEVGLGDLKSRKDVPLLDESLQTTVPGVYIAGELAGLALVRNAAVQGRQAMERIARRVAEEGGGDGSRVMDVAIVGAGPSGLSAALTAASSGLSWVHLEKEESLGGSLLHYPRRKMVLTQPVALPPWGALDREEYEKEALLELFEGMVSQLELPIRFGSPVESVEPEEDHYLLRTGSGDYRARYVLLALGRRGSPRKLGVPGEDHSKVMYRLLDALSYQGKKILVVGGGDSAAEAAIGLSRQSSNEVWLSYRKDKLVRLKKKNLDAIEPLIERGRIRAILGSNVTGISPDQVQLTTGSGEILGVDNDYVFVFAGGVPPFGFLKGIGVAFGGETEPGAVGRG